MTEYQSTGFEPAAPVAEVSFRNPESGLESRTCRLLIDTGADLTLVPISALEEIEVSPDPGRTFQLQGFDGSRSTAQAADLVMRFLNKSIRGRFVLIDREIGILGRDVLNHFKIALDGPAQKWGEF